MGCGQVARLVCAAGELADGYAVLAGGHGAVVNGSGEVAGDSANENVHKLCR